MAAVLTGILWGSEFRDTIVDTAIATSGLGPTPIFLAPTILRARGKRERALWKPWSTKCLSAWSFAKRCSGMRERHTNFAICKRAEEIAMDWGGIFIVPPRMDSDWKRQSMVLGRASTVCPT